MTRLKSTIQMSYSSCSIIKLLRDCHTPCRKGKEKSDKGEKCREIPWPGRQVPEAEGNPDEQDVGLL